MDELTGKTLGDYRLLEEIGRGGMSVVYKALDLEQEEVVTIKVLSPYVAQETRFRERFDREIKLLEKLNQDNIVPILSYGEQDGLTYIAMPFYEGGTLQKRIDEGGLELRQVGPILEDIARALDYAHKRNVVHRDIKPSNILIDTDGRALVSDFGFAYVSTMSHSLTGSVLIGTPAFMSPEQSSGEQVDAKSDQYSLGAVLYQATTGKLPFEADTPMAVVLKHINEPLPRPRYVNPYIPDAVEAVIQRAMEKNPNRRFDSVGELHAAFESALAEALDPETGLPKPESIGPAPETQVIAAAQDTRSSLWARSRASLGLAVLAMVALPVTAWSLTGGLPASNAAVSGTLTPSGFLLATIDALSTANAEALGGSQEPGMVESAVAATVEALGLFETAEAEATNQASSTSTPTIAPSAAPFSTSGGGDSGSGDEDSPPPPPPPAPPPTATSTPSPIPTTTSSPGTPGPSNTPTDTLVPPTNTSVPPSPTETPIPTIKPSQCKFTPTHPHYCTPTPES
jgi:serine/threonine protein kinase